MRTGPWLLVLLALAAGCSGKVQTTQVPPGLAVSPEALDFKTVAVGSSSALQVTMQAQTVTAVSISGISVTDDGDGAASAFSLDSTPTQVPGSGSRVVKVTFAPTAVRSYAATLTIESNDSSRPSQMVSLKGSGGARAVSVSLQDPSGATALLGGDGGLSMAFVAPYGGSSGISWPQVLMTNTGAIGANLIGFHFERGDAGFFLPTTPVLPQAIAPEQTRALEVGFAPPAGNLASALSDALTLDFDDPAFPSATIALSAQVQVDQPPVACAFVESAQELDGTVERAASGPVQVEPGARVQLTAFADDIADAGEPACSYDPEDGRANLGFHWSVASAPAGSRAALSAPNGPRPVFVPDLPGDYSISLQVQDAEGASASATVDFTAAPLEDLTVKLLWPGFSQVDLDLHFVRPGGRPFSSADDVSSLTRDGGHDWGTATDPTDDPHFSGDDQGDGNLEESVWMNRPQDGCLPDGGCSYGVWVHYFQDRRALDGGDCGQNPCLEGTACGCAGSNVCEPGHVCALPVEPQVQVFLKGQAAPALEIPVDPLSLASPCFTWHAVEIAWRADGGLAGFVLPGDGGEIEYWGSSTNAIRECAPPYAPTTPPILSP